jgi:hypothetical protein
MNWPLVVVLTLLVGYILSETALPAVKEGFLVPQRSDIGYARTGWGEEAGYTRDARYTEAFVDIMGHGVAADFCRAVRRTNDPDSLCIACALGTRDGMDTMEYRSRSKRDGFRFSRDDYWRPNKTRKGRQDYCRIVRDESTGHWYATCAIAGRDGFKTEEERDTDPPPAIQELLRAYEGIMTWFRWRDDGEDYAHTSAYEIKGHAIVPSELGVIQSRGLQLNRWSPAEQQAGMHPRPAHDYLRWGEKGALRLDQDVQPRQIRAIAFWVYWDALEKGARVLECSNGGKKDLLWLGIEGGGTDLPPAAPLLRAPADEVAPCDLLAVGQLTEPARYSRPAQKPAPKTPLSTQARYVFEIWDQEQRLFRLESSMGSVKPQTWQHIVVTTTNADAWWPTWEMYIDGKVVANRQDGRLSPAITLTENYIGKGVRGCIQDFRVYRDPMSARRVHEAITWGQPHLHQNP